jgi:hypothetical protein
MLQLLRQPLTFGSPVGYNLCANTQVACRHPIRAICKPVSKDGRHLFRTLPHDGVRSRSTIDDLLLKLWTRGNIDAHSIPIRSISRAVSHGRCCTLVHHGIPTRCLLLTSCGENVQEVADLSSLGSILRRENASGYLAPSCSVRGAGKGEFVAIEVRDQSASIASATTSCSTTGISYWVCGIVPFQIPRCSGTAPSSIRTKAACGLLTLACDPRDHLTPAPVEMSAVIFAERMGSHVLANFWNAVAVESHGSGSIDQACRWSAVQKQCELNAQKNGGPHTSDQSRLLSLFGVEGCRPDMLI